MMGILDKRRSYWKPRGTGILAGLEKARSQARSEFNKNMSRRRISKNVALLNVFFIKSSYSINGMSKRDSITLFDQNLAQSFRNPVNITVLKTLSNCNAILNDCV